MSRLLGFVQVVLHLLPKQRLSVRGRIRTRELRRLLGKLRQTYADRTRKMGRRSRPLIFANIGWAVS
ncbi:hypothetical protein CGCA056_v011868 [Colletotrichum aenigma]|uniref:uncharacterized protein n=1 Tax=Colletotrichum aenigma TaxID=1215731 RepID=UPI00187294A2|nr:uncharacterized protein CGCA056_v011868 [Colletotrichum aenigma]KAF5512668.1 hypothetical protein CGCA056_v011868 [Colletotrichum aenigma]